VAVESIQIAARAGAFADAAECELAQAPDLDEVGNTVGRRRARR